MSVLRVANVLWETRLTSNEELIVSLGVGPTDDPTDGAAPTGGELH